MIRHTSATLVHANSVAMSRLAGPVVKEVGVSSLGHLRDIMRLSRAALRDLSDHQRLLAVSTATRNWYVALGLTPTQVQVEYNGVDLRHFSPHAPSGYLHRELDIAEHCRLVGTVGQIGMRKGVDVFLEAARTVATHHEDVHFLIVGQRYSQKAEAIEFERQLHCRASCAAYWRGEFIFSVSAAM